ncbi:M20/M25/M40 family metallo-hydrolase [Methylobacterium sp. NMS14P]|uniref:M20/M25/M40 family metallo-hydrolase n=1 Tax=Methylobacterium sp. NMS14P TaxID=2894310 RepID=UPI002359B903|nr:M20/M25/M40 family metallo-hydrolase [Methylobacterium sp. NMS14P]WCS25701.1 M20/M25/M40 family metallo-hydrolase [Methylobacterium sp. NMS14P]
MTYDALIDSIGRQIDEQREVLVDLCAEFVAAPSMNPPGRTAEVAEVLQRFLGRHGVSSERIAVDDEAVNVVTTLAGSRPGRHVVFNAHMDTMQAGDEAAWTVPILQQTREDGRLYGLGMGNLKGGLAAMALATVTLASCRDRLPGSLSFTAVCDEVMFGNRGTEHLLAVRPDFTGDFMISAEGPGYMDFAIAEKGLLWVDVEASGEAGHSSRALRGETAVSRLARFITAADAFNETYSEPPAELAGVTGGEGNLGLRLSASAGVLAAGEVRSLVAPMASAHFDFRMPPGITARDVKDRLERIAQEIPGIRLSYPKEWDASWESSGSSFTKTFAEVVEEVRNAAPRLVVRLPGSDARHWRDRGVPAICYGPQPTLSAGADDYANEQDLIDCAKIYAIAAIKLMSASQSGKT